MVTVSSAAHDVIAHIPDQPLMGIGAGLRIARRPGEGERLAVTMSAGPEEGEVLFEADRARLFVGPVAARHLDGKLLDVRYDGQGRLEFVASNRSPLPGDIGAADPQLAI